MRARVKASKTNGQQNYELYTVKGVCLESKTDFCVDVCLTEGLGLLAQCPSLQFISHTCRPLARKRPPALLHLDSQRFLSFETVPLFVCLTDDLLSSFQGRSLSTSSFNASLPQPVDGVMFSGLCPKAVSQAPQHLKPACLENFYPT